jgi:hypothetical protein
MARVLVQSQFDRGHTDDLQTQLESLLDMVWRCERMWKLDDRIKRQIEADTPPEVHRGKRFD